MNKIDFKGNPAQIKAASWWYDQETLSICYAGGKWSGKTYLAMTLLFSSAESYPGTQYFIASNKLADLRKFTHLSISEVLTSLGITAKFMGQDNYWVLPNGSRIYYLETAAKVSDPLYARFGSIQMTSGVIEHGQRVERGAYYALLACVNRLKNKDYGIKGKLLVTAIPSTENFIYQDFYLPHLNGTLSSESKFIQALIGDNMYQSEDYIAALKKILSVQEYNRIVLGNWIDETE